MDLDIGFWMKGLIPFLKTISCPKLGLHYKAQHAQHLTESNSLNSMLNILLRVTLLILLSFSSQLLRMCATLIHNSRRQEPSSLILILFLIKRVAQYVYDGTHH